LFGGSVTILANSSVSMPLILPTRKSPTKLISWTWIGWDRPDLYYSHRVSIHCHNYLFTASRTALNVGLGRMISLMVDLSAW